MTTTILSSLGIIVMLSFALALEVIWVRRCSDWRSASLWITWAIFSIVFFASSILRQLGYVEIDALALNIASKVLYYLAAIALLTSLLRKIFE